MLRTRLRPRKLGPPYPDQATGDKLGPAAPPPDLCTLGRFLVKYQTGIQFLGKELTVQTFWRVFAIMCKNTYGSNISEFIFLKGIEI